MGTKISNGELDAIGRAAATAATTTAAAVPQLRGAAASATGTPLACFLGLEVGLDVGSARMIDGGGQEVHLGCRSAGGMHGARHADVGARLIAASVATCARPLEGWTAGQRRGGTIAASLRLVASPRIHGIQPATMPAKSFKCVFIPADT